jgi:uncharacterized protein with GYD domain
MLFILWFKFGPENTHKVIELWKHYKYPADVKLVNRYLLIGRHTSVAIFDAPDEESLIKIAGPFSNLGVAHISPAMKLEEALKVTW